MHLCLIVETADHEQVWNGFRLANTALDGGHRVSAFLLGEAVTAPDLEAKSDVNPHGVLVQFRRNGGELLACGTCMDSRDLEPTELRPEAGMSDLLELIESADETITIG
ncbi:MAG: DsrE family protein [Halodesulfurarchaeum sp.]